MNELVVLFGQDITETVLNDAAPAAGRDLQLLVSSANAAIFGVDINGLVNIWNRKTAELTGYRREEAIGKPLVKFFGFDPINNLFAQTLKGEEVGNYQGQFTTRNGDVIHLLINFTCRRDENGFITGGLAVSQDVTQNALRDK